MNTARMNRIASVGEMTSCIESVFENKPKQQFCSCGAPLDNESLGRWASLLTECTSCIEKHREAEAARQLEEREERRKALRKAKAHERWEKVVPKKYRETDPKHPNFPRGLDAFAQAWLADVLDGEGSRVWCGLIGESGKGKTRVMSRVMRQKIHSGEDCHWINATRFQWACQYQFDDERGAIARKALERMLSCEFLAFDDLGKQKWNPTVESHFYDLLEHRDSECKQMIWTSNSTLEELALMLSKDRAKPIVGRLSESSNIAEI